MTATAKPETYNDVIQRATGTDRREAATIEVVLRVTTPTLDHLTRGELGRLARKAQADLADLRAHDPEVAAWYEEQGRDSMTPLDRLREITAQNVAQGAAIYEVRGDDNR